MNQNPYAAPALPYAPPPPPPGAGQPGPLRASDAFAQAWERFKQCWGVLVGGYAVVYVLSTGVGQTPTVLGALNVVPQATLVPWKIGAGILSMFVGSFFHVGFVRMTLQAARGEDPEFGLLFSGADRFLPTLGASLLAGVVMCLGCAMLIVPGVLVMLAFSFATYYVIDAGMGPMQALDASVKATRGQWGEVFLLWVLFTLATVAGTLCCCIGLLAALPLGQLAVTYAFIRVSGRGALPPADRPNEWPAAPAP